VPNWYKNNPELTICVAEKGVDGFTEVPWNKNEPKGGHYAAAKDFAIRRGFDDVEEIGVLNRGNGFIFKPIIRNREVQNA